MKNVESYLTLPAVLRHGGHDGAEAGGVVQLVAVLAGDGARVARRLAATHLAHAARAARPPGAHPCNTTDITYIFILLTTLTCNENAIKHLNKNV